MSVIGNLLTGNDVAAGFVVRDTVHWAAVPTEGALVFQAAYPHDFCFVSANAPKVLDQVSMFRSFEVEMLSEDLKTRSDGM